jgi:hypothetical protein
MTPPTGSTDPAKDSRFTSGIRRVRPSRRCQVHPHWHTWKRAVEVSPKTTRPRDELGGFPDRNTRHYGALIPAPRMTREQGAAKGIPGDADFDQPWRRLPATRHRPLGPPGSGTPAWRPGPAGCPRSARGPVSGRLTRDRDVAGRFQDRAGPLMSALCVADQGRHTWSGAKKVGGETVPANTPANSSIAASASRTAI